MKYVDIIILEKQRLIIEFIKISFKEYVSFKASLLNEEIIKKNNKSFNELDKFCK